MRKLLTTSALSLFILGLSACGKGDEQAVASPAQDAARIAYTKEIMDWRADRLARLQRPDGWLSLVGMHWVEVGTTRVGSAEDNGTQLRAGPPHIGILTLDKSGELSFVPEKKADITIDGQPAVGRVKLVADADAGDTGPTVVGFNKGDASFIVIKRGDRYALRVRDALAPTRTGFEPIPYFPIDPAFRIKVTFKPHPPGTQMDVLNIISIVEKMDNPGTVTFEKDGKRFTLEAIDEGDHRLFFVFSDRTSGHESYAAARFVYAAYPGADGTTILDFNKTYDPPCAFTPYATCPLPPAQNRMDIAIRAGEKKPLKTIEERVPGQ
jgi:uncharacterized protein (DUF1684 family)